MTVPLFAPLSQVKKLGFSFFVLLMIIGLWLGADLIYGEMAQQMQLVLIGYAIMLVLVRQEMPKTEHKQTHFTAALPLIFISAGVTFFVFLTLSQIGLIRGVLVASTLEAAISFTAAFSLAHAFVKAYIEEEVFRGRFSTKLGEAGQALLFGGFHVFILYMLMGFSLGLITALGWLTFMGLVWGFIENRWGLEGSTGSHFGYNIVAMGLAPLLLGASVI